MNRLKRILHVHRGPIIGVSHYDSISGPRTIPLCRCSTCGKRFNSSTIRGWFSVEELNQ